MDQFLAEQQGMLDEVGQALQLKQDAYDSEVYTDLRQQAKWQTWIDEELEKTKAYASKIFGSEIGAIDKHFK